ncbi:MAG: tRNA (adenosine(37)-N6)-dimethylallyltransferase MiaA [Gammaproteobacteria bacterium]|nr:tRNA (adenosine(37)-N6)-dimethylallyltransferase MiaA [Gammaproteobacteria bacterium]
MIDLANNPQPFVIFLMGPTASGKTDLAIDLVQELPCDIISVDSALVYRGMDIGTAKPSAEEQARAPHRLIDICDPIESYSAARFRQDALGEIEEIISRGRIPLLVGGTMLYFRALQYGLSELPDANSEIRARLDAEAKEFGLESLHTRLQQLDPVAALRINCNDSQRIQRALEVYELTGRPLSELQQRDGEPKLPYPVIKLVRAPGDRSVLHARIRQRFLCMLEQGFEDEVTGLLQKWELDHQMPAMRLVGYRQMLHYLQGEYSREEMVERGVIATRQLAKRQFTWLRSEQDANWLSNEKSSVLDQALKTVFSSASRG